MNWSKEEEEALIDNLKIMPKGLYNTQEIVNLANVSISTQRTSLILTKLQGMTTNLERVLANGRMMWLVR